MNVVPRLKTLVSWQHFVAFLATAERELKGKTIARNVIA